MLLKINQLLNFRTQQAHQSAQEHMSDRDAQHAFFRSASPQAWHSGAMKAGRITAGSLSAMLKKQHKLDLTPDTCNKLLAKYGQLSSAQDAERLFQQLRAAHGVFDSQEGAEDEQLSPGTAAGALQQLVAQLGGSADMQQCAAVLPSYECEFDAFLTGLLQLQAGM